MTSTCFGMRYCDKHGFYNYTVRNGVGWPPPCPQCEGDKMHPYDAQFRPDEDAAYRPKLEDAASINKNANGALWMLTPEIKKAQAILDEFHSAASSQIDNATDILTEASKVIYGDREKTYGDPGKNIRVIADYWVAYLHSIGWSHDGKALDYDDVCNMMVLLKIARLSNTPMHRDSLVDACGYLALAERIQNADLAQKEGTDPSTPRS